MAGGAPDREMAKNDAQDLESRIEVAMHSRVSHFKEQADSLTFEGVRRAIEKDLELDPYALDVHKRFVKQCLLECLALDGADDDNASKSTGETAEQNVSTTEGAKTPEGHQSTKDVKEPCSEDAEKPEDSPVLGLLTGHETTKSENEESEGDLSKELPSESIIKKAIRKRAAYVKANSEEVTMAGLRRLLEEDLKLVKYALDPRKKFITEALEEVLQSGEVLEPLAVDKKKKLKKTSSSKALKKVSSEGSSDSSDGETGEEEEEVKSKKKIVSKRKIQNSEGLKKRKRPEKETKVSSKKQIKAVKMESEGNSDAENSGIVSEDGHSQSSADKPAKKKEVATPAYGKRVEHLKTVIKSCGMSVPPSVYKKVKQAPENKRESQLIKELENILSREGLSSNPSEKEIKEVKKKKERAKELEGIDMNNIVSSSRRRNTTSFVVPPKPKIPDESDSGDSEDTDDENEDSDDDDEDNDADKGNDDDDDDNQSEELNGENDEDSD
ncbi:hypothetical protein LWI28_022499 [Acer negundo]|uniref:DEK-C domain-containing protein n=1 Tax=Acer negundo TaxID=4023 RepID=A0AAD5JVJ9_ACENE|nr:hypothetical protein LWI28_022499 [Acer negundo]KAK4860486.1 hypothetical protein QYF36_024700 [Acer negundo]